MRFRGYDITFNSIMNFASAYWRKYFSKRYIKQVNEKTYKDFTDLELPLDIVDIIEGILGTDKPYVEKVVAIRELIVSYNSPECITSGRCVHCKCSTPDKFYETDACSHGCYKKFNQ